MKKISRPYISALLWWLLTVYLFTLPGSAFPDRDWPNIPHFDKLVHAFLFFVLVWLFYRAGLPAFSPRRMAIIIVIAIVYGIAIEYVQLYWVANRSFDVIDIAADAVGCLMVPVMLKFAWFRRLSSNAHAGH